MRTRLAAARQGSATSQCSAYMLCVMILAAGLPGIAAQPRAAPQTAPPTQATATPAAPPMMARPVAAPPVVAVTPPIRAPAVAVTPPTRAPASGPSGGATIATLATPSVAPSRSPATSPTTALITAPAPGPLGSGSVNATVSITSSGALNSAQQQQLCSVLVVNLRQNFPSVTQCTVTSQSVVAPATFGTTGRRLQQSGSTVTIILNLILTSASQQQMAGIQAAISGLQITIGTQATAVTVITVIFLPGTITIPIAPVPPTPGATIPGNTVITASPPNGGTLSTVVTVVPPTATGNTTINVTRTAAQPPAPPAGGTSTTTTIMNGTTATVATTIASYSLTLQVTVIVQYFFTSAIGGNIGTLVMVQFNLPGNVTTNLPISITGGATTGQTKTIAVVGATIATVVTPTITITGSPTTTSTTTGTTITATTGGNGGGGGTATPPTTTAPGIISGVTRQVCQVPLNPYGIIQNTANEGTLIKGAFLISSWNDLNGNAGQGRLIYQCLPNGTTTIWSNVSISGACTADNAGVGVTMALSRCGSVIIVGSLPIVPGANANPGCLIALDLTGRTINEVRSPGINGPWGSICTTNGNQITLAVSSVLGGLAPSNSSTSSTGRRLQQAPAPGPSAAASGGMLVRWTFPTPTAGSTWSLGSPTFLLTGIMTNGSMGVQTGVVGPGEPTLDNQGTMYVPDNLGNRLLAIPNAMTTSSASSATLTLGTQVLQGPNSLFFGNGNQLLGTNTLDNNLFFVNLNSARNGGTASTLLVDSQPAAGNLFNAVLSVDSGAGAPIGSIWYQHDGTSTFNTVIGSGAPLMAPSLAPQTARPSGAPAAG